MNEQHSDENPKSVQSETPVLLVGGGFPDPLDIVNFVAKAPFVTAADGGADFCLQNGVTPDVVIGDLDSLSDEAHAALAPETLIKYIDQNLTDFEKCLTLITAPYILATGFTAGRLDHLLAVFAVMARRIGPPVLLVGSDDVAFAASESLCLDLPPGVRLSIFPLVPTKGTSEGLLWPIDDLTIDPKGRLGTSNETTGPVKLTFDKPGAIILVPRVHLTAIEAAMTG